MKMTGNRRQYIIKKARHDRKIVGIWFLIVAALFFMGGLSRFAYIAVSGHVGNVDLNQRTTDKYRHQKILWAQRGTIYAHDGSKIAYSDKSYQIYAVLNKNYKNNQHKPLYVVDKTRTAHILSQYIPLSESEIYRILTPKNKNTFQVEFGSAGHNLSLNVKMAIEQHHLPGIYFYSTAARSYPNEVFASNTIGLAQPVTKHQQTDLQGTMGLEQYFNKELQGKNGYEIRNTDPEGYTLPQTRPAIKTPIQGKNIYTTLDQNYQQYLETLIKTVYRKYRPRQIQAIVTNPKTGDILAITQRPSFNPVTKVGLNKAWLNQATQITYEPGSVFKVLTLATAINSHRYNPNQYYHSGSVTVGGRVINDWNHTGWGDIPLSEAFPRSSNVGMVFLEQQIGADRWLKYLKTFHIGQKTGVTLPEEVRGKINFQRTSDQAVTAFGQSVAVTALQMVQALSAVGNKGQMMRPRIVSQIVDPNTGQVKKLPPHVAGQPITAKTAKAVLAAMRDVVQKDYGTGQAYKIDNQDIAVKTGTAQIPGQNGNYLTGSNDYIYSVAGLAPATNPKYLVYITMEQPQSLTEAPEKILSEVFNPMMQRLLGTGTIENVSAQTEAIAVADMTGKSRQQSINQLEKRNLKVGVVGTGNTIVQQLPVAKSKILTDQRVILLTNGLMTMPDVKDWSKNDLLKLSYITGKKIVMEGHGYAVQQSVAPGAILNKVDQIIVQLK